MSSALLISFLIGSIIMSNGEIVNVTTSDSTGDYYIAEGGNFDRNEVECSSNVACYIECDARYSCYATVINCGNAPICDIQCSGTYSCEWLSVYISPNNTTISCGDYGSCKGVIRIYNDYSNYPSSTTLVNFHGSGGCYKIAIKNATTKEDNYEELTEERFKVYCDWCSWNDYGITKTITTTPSVVNETGEYYYYTGSLVNIECSTDKLCHIDCNNGGCRHSKIDCGPAEECTILCEIDTGCGFLDVKAVGMRQFNHICSRTQYCNWSNYNLTNIDSVNITCSGAGGANMCQSNDYNIKSVRDLNVVCNFYWSCFSYYRLTDVDNAVIICNGSCQGTNWELNNVGYQKFDCIGDVTNPYSPTDEEACNDININGQETSQLDMFCENEYSCQDITICTDNIFNIDCQGSSSCRKLNLCDETANSNKTNIIKPPTAEPTTLSPTEYPTTAIPTQYPTTTEPTQHPTTAQPTEYPTTAIPTTGEPTANPTTGEPTDTPTTSQPSAPTTEPTEKPTDTDIPIDNNGGNRLFGLFWMVLVITFGDFLQIM